MEWLNVALYDGASTTMNVTSIISAFPPSPKYNGKVMDSTE